MHNTKKPSPALKELSKLLALLPEKQVEKQFKKQWEKQTKCLDNPQKNTKQIEKLQNQNTKEIKYENKPVYNWLEELKTKGNTNENKKFTKWYKNEYHLISLKKQGLI